MVFLSAAAIRRQVLSASCPGAKGLREFLFYLLTGEEPGDILKMTKILVILTRKFVRMEA